MGLVGFLYAYLPTFKKKKRVSKGNTEAIGYIYAYMSAVGTSP